jgi:hypothetical protein
MYMKQHILAALREEFDQWEELLGSMGEAQITAPHLPSSWSTKDYIAHLWAWQQRSVARVEAAQLDREPVFPAWPIAVDPEAEGAANQVNAWVYETYHTQPWPAIHQQWRAGFLQLLEGAAMIAEKDLLESDRYPWLGGYSVAFILVASYNHHHEHLEKTVAWLQGHESNQNNG